MAKIYQYQKVTDRYTTHVLRLPAVAEDESQPPVTELCTIDGWTYVSVPDEVVLPEQSKEVAETLQPVTLDAGTRAAIEAASPHCRLIRERTKEKIRAELTLDDELKLIRDRIAAIELALTAKGSAAKPDSVYAAKDAIVQAARDWGEAEKAKLIGIIK